VGCNLEPRWEFGGSLRVGGGLQHCKRLYRVSYIEETLSMYMCESMLFRVFRVT